VVCGRVGRGAALALCAASAAAWLLVACRAEPRPRAVSLSPAVTQVVAALGLSDAVTPIDPSAADAFARALASGTNLVLSDGGAESAGVRAAFASRNVAVRSFAPYTTDEVYGAYREIAALLGDPSAGEALVRRVGDELDKLSAGSAAAARANVALVLERKPLRVATGDAFLSKLLAAAGADNAFADLSAGSGAIRPELLAERAPRQLDVAPQLAATAWVDPGGTAQRLRDALAEAAR
jgi:ABC-type hemin transport system substrate-binding protein